MATDDLECKAFSYERDYIDIYSNSWGPDDRGFKVDGPGPLAQRALESGAEKVTIILSDKRILNCRNRH